MVALGPQRTTSQNQVNVLVPGPGKTLPPALLLEIGEMMEGSGLFSPSSPHPLPELNADLSLKHFMFIGCVCQERC